MNSYRPQWETKGLYFLLIILIACSQDNRQWDLSAICHNISQKYNTDCLTHDRGDTLVYNLTIDSIRIYSDSKLYLFRGLVLYDSYLANKGKNLNYSVFQLNIFLKKDRKIFAALYANREHLYNSIYSSEEIPELAEMKVFLWESTTALELFLFESLVEMNSIMDASPEYIKIPSIVDNFLLDRLKGIENGESEKVLMTIIEVIQKENYELDIYPIEHILEFGQSIKPRLNKDYNWPKWDEDFDYIKFLQEKTSEER